MEIAATGDRSDGVGPTKSGSAICQSARANTRSWEHRSNTERKGVSPGPIVKLRFILVTVLRAATTSRTTVGKSPAPAPAICGTVQLRSFWASSDSLAIPRAYGSGGG